MRGAVERVVARDLVVVGSGAAGLTAALGAAPLSVALVTKTDFGGGASGWAQGGIAAAVGADDSPALHARDTLEAAAGLAEPAVVELLTREGPERIRGLLALGARFDRDREGRLALGREAAHSRRRILHARGDATGAEVVRALAAAVRRAPEVELYEGTRVLELAVEGGRVVGVLTAEASGRRTLFLARAVVLATGGVGSAFLATTNPPEATGDGLAIAARAGARLVDLEFVQFHPTALAVRGADPLPLLTEALRGEGAVVVDGAGRRFLAAEHPLAELAPRDVVARAICRRLAAGEEVFLDASGAIGERFPERFPTVFALCRRHGLDPRSERLPVSPAAHYHMGGIAVDADGRTSLPGLWAAGEVTATGVHGANRLASNSLLEALVFGARVAGDLRRHLPPREAVGRVLAALPTAAGAAGDDAEAGRETVAAVRRLLWRRVGVVRDGAKMAPALAELSRLSRPGLPPPARDLVTVARLITAAALARRESRGAHFRTDFPAADPAWARHLEARLAADGGVEVTGLPADHGAAESDRGAAAGGRGS